jgi:hypothetical protein
MPFTQCILQLLFVILRCGTFLLTRVYQSGAFVLRLQADGTATVALRMYMYIRSHVHVRMCVHVHTCSAASS